MDLAPHRSRLVHLDGLRGLAILAVVLYHAYSRWPNVPALYIPWFATGHLGVQLFFLLSGFLIFHSLEASGSFPRFLYRRWLRLFPAMVAVTWFVFTTSLYFCNRVEGLPGWLDCLPGISLVEAHWWRDWLAVPVTGPLEGDFWTLFTEVKFYALFGASFALIGRRAVWVLAAVAAYGLLLQLLQQVGIYHHWPLAIADELNAPCYGWFAAGAFLYLYWDSGRRTALVASILAAVVAVLANASLNHAFDLVCQSAVYGIFILPFFVESVRVFFGRPILGFFGFVSYPLYLLHENATWATILRLREAIPGLPAWLLPLPPLAAAVTLAWLLARFIEPAARMLLPAVGQRKDGARVLSPGQALAALAFAAVAALLVTQSLFRPVRPNRLEREAAVVRTERDDLDPLEAKVAAAARDLANVRQARIDAEATLSAMRHSNPP